MQGPGGAQGDLIYIWRFLICSAVYRYKGPDPKKRRCFDNKRCKKNHQNSSPDSPDDFQKSIKKFKILKKKKMKILYKRYFNHKTRLNRCRNRIFQEKLQISMYIRHIDHRSGAPWGPHGREGGKFFSRQSRKQIFPGKGPHRGAPWGARSHAIKINKVKVFNSF